jgi:hypothetical protein
MLWEQQMPILLEPRQIRAQDTHPLRVGVDSSGLCRGAKQKTSCQSTILNIRVYLESTKFNQKSRRRIPRCGGAIC